eukprot:CAMPEP_0172088526 /NCGR_PEP_ID=MMETSP1043-20130122/23281_1 /TAXON_ID=464988 /ORGANISM="Hemiselmis andersenii, Strain CCMP441" /LENGTH=41 /DNA_ID= /DNA_START= /DNA_END= /DNA_ORIENTATION=
MLKTARNVEPPLVVAVTGAGPSDGPWDIDTPSPKAACRNTL